MDKVTLSKWFPVALAAASAFVAALVCAGPARALSYSAVEYDDGRCRPNCGSIIVARGEIGADEVDVLQAFLRRLTPDTRFHKMLLIHSVGGNALGGMKLGSYLRQNRVAVVVAKAVNDQAPGVPGFARGFCGPACVLALAGGVRRVVPAGSSVAIAEPPGSATGNPAAMREAFASYYSHMGVDPELLTLPKGAEEGAARILSAAEISRFRLAEPTL